MPITSIANKHLCFKVIYILFLGVAISGENSKAVNAANTSNEETSYLMPNLKADQIPKGRVEKFIFLDSHIFPGTSREVSVFIPNQYKGSELACVLVAQDGTDLSRLMELLVASKQMPVTVGIFVKPGILYPPESYSGIPRFNRQLEYDSLDDGYARFLDEELLPYIAKRFDLKLSTNGNDRCISGASSGGIAAFTAAWERPDLFSRVYCSSGSFVAFRGGNNLPAFVRKFEPKPIRLFLTVGTKDMINWAGEWLLHS